ncbi:MAG TPA: 4-alpha-glucanotransferase [Gemmatimonadaceae bacterium]|nr:4-alpha-glucanotransferase [Gemmatimonadaceae bacterium]
MTPTRDRPALRALAERVGILSEYLDQTGKERRRTSDETRVALLRAMGIDASDESAARASLDAIDARERDRLLAPVRIVRRARQRTLRIEIMLPDGWSGAVHWELELVEETGEVHRKRGRARPRRDGRMSIAAPRLPAIGYHRLRLRLTAGADERESEQSLIIVPPGVPAPRDVLGDRRVFGLIANLYTVRSERNWGVGDLDDLCRLIVWSAGIGAEFVGVNPLHALRNRGKDISPYSPVSRVYRNAIYIAPDSVPELADSPVARELMDSAEFASEVEALRAGDRVDYQRTAELKRPVLRALHATFTALHRDRQTERGRSYARWLEMGGERLVYFATFAALDEHFTREGRDGGFRAWPAEYHDPNSAAVRDFAQRHAEDVDFYRWVQFELDRQLAVAAESGRDAGLAIGLYQDLAIGTSPSGSDVWSAPDLFVEDVSIGAPPDPYSATGQNWGLPPIHPWRLREQGYGYWIAVLRAALRHAGALRIDHVMGLFRQFWIPEGKSGTEGAYVRYPAEDLLGILALEATRAGALVVGEDLGTVPKEVPPALRRWGILSSRVLYFERGRGGSFLPPKRYPARSLATANTHDMPTIAGFWYERDLEVRREVGLAGERETRQERRERQRDRKMLVHRLAAEGIIADPRAPLDDVALRAAVHEFLCRTPAVLVGFSLDDVAGEVEPVNVPGVGPDRYPSWTRRIRPSLERMAFDPAVAAVVRCARLRSGGKRER